MAETIARTFADTGVKETVAGLAESAEADTWRVAPGKVEAGDIAGNGF